MRVKLAFTVKAAPNLFFSRGFVPVFLATSEFLNQKVIRELAEFF